MKATRGILDKLDDVFEALRLAYMMLLGAACEAEDRGDKKSMHAYDKATERCRLALIGIGVLQDRSFGRKPARAAQGRASIGKPRKPSSKRRK